MSDVAAYGGLFFVAFLAATIFPAQSEAVLIGLLSTKSYSTALLLAVASLGNILGSLLNWWLGRRIEDFKDKKWFPVKEEGLLKAQRFYMKYGRWSLLLSWLPFIGDPMTVVAGVMRERLWIFLSLVTIAKVGRYVSLVALYNL